MSTPTRFRRRLPRALVVLLVVVGLTMGILAAFQRQLIYFPDSSPVPRAGEVVEGARDVTLHTSDGLDVGAWFVPASSAPGLLIAVLVAPGNGGNREGRGGLA